LIVFTYSLCSVGRLYRFLFDTFLADTSVAEICVEDPSELFTELRMKNDLRRILKEPLNPFTSGSLPSKESIEEVREKLKLSKMHMAQLCELAAMKYVPASDKDARRKFRVWVKKRIYRKNEEVLGTIEDVNERKTRIAETFDACMYSLTRLCFIVFWLFNF
jgi:histone acetyltransferase 1